MNNQFKDFIYLIGSIISIVVLGSLWLVVSIPLALISCVIILIASLSVTIRNSIKKKSKKKKITKNNEEYIEIEFNDDIDKKQNVELTKIEVLEKQKEDLINLKQQLLLNSNINKNQRLIKK